jgi:hypothetical protein
MNLLDFLKYWLDTHPIMFGIVSILSVFAIGELFSSGKNRFKL